MAIATVCFVFPAMAGNGKVFDGREYSVHIPDLAGSGAHKAAVFILHGGKSDGDRVRHLTQFDTLANAYGAVAVYPSSPDKFWNDGRGVTLSSDSARDDGRYLAALISHLFKQGVIPSRKVYFAGISNGGGMAMYMACKHPEHTAGIAIVATKLPESLDCSRYSPVPALFFHGDKDRLSPHSGRKNGDEGIGGKNAGANLSSRETARAWAQLNGCGDTFEEKRKDTDPDDGTAVAAIRFNNCRAPLEYYVIEGGGHTWPGALQANVGFIARRMLGLTSKEIDAGLQSMRLWFGEGDWGRP